MISSSSRYTLLKKMRAKSKVFMFEEILVKCTFVEAQVAGKGIKHK